MANRLPSVLVYGSALAFAACGGEGITLPPEGEAAHIEVIRGDGQQDVVGSVLGDSVVVEVTDVRDRPVANATVTFTFPDADAAAAPDNAITNSEGIAWAKVTLGTEVGPVAGVAEVPVNPGITPVRATFTAEALAAGANRITRVSGDEQSGPVGTDLTAALVVQVTDEHGNPIPNVTVDWSVEGGGSVSAITTLTGENGQASVTRTLGPAAGPQAAFATAGGLAGSPVSFSHTATAGSASRVNIISGDDQTGAPGAALERLLVVEVVDEANNPVVNAAVEWVVAQGGGSATPPSNRTDGQGRASTQWTLGPSPGNNILNAVVSGVGRAEFSAVGERTASSASITSDTPDPSTVGQGIQVAVTVSGEGGTPTGTVTVTGEGAAGPCTITLAGGSGSCEIVLNQAGNRQLTATYNGDGRFEGDTDTESHQVNPVAPPNNPPTAAFTPPSCTATQSCQFTDGSSDSDGNVVAWSWTFGDPASGGSNTSNEKNPSHTYAAPGTYNVTLTVTDDDGAQSTIAHDVSVGIAPPGNNAPVAVNDSYEVPADGVLTVGFAQRVLVNDTDEDPSTLTAELIQDVPAGQGDLQNFDASGTFDYHPDDDATAGQVITFTYRARDSQGVSSNEATVSITITP